MMLASGIISTSRDPFESDFNVVRYVTNNGLYTIRGEFIRASRILSTRPERAVLAIAQQCEERVEGGNPAASPTTAFVPPQQLSPFPPQIPYTVGSRSMRQTKTDVPDPKSISDMSPKSPHPKPLLRKTRRRLTTWLNLRLHFIISYQFITCYYKHGEAHHSQKERGKKYEGNVPQTAQAVAARPIKVRGAALHGEYFDLVP